MNSREGFDKGSAINYSCNPKYKLFGRKVLYCVDGSWERDIPECILETNVCRKKPPYKIGPAQIVSLKFTRISNEYAFYYKTNEIRLYTRASYTCPGNKFNVTDQSLIKYKVIIFL